MSSRAVALSLGSNIEPRLGYLRAGTAALGRVIRLVRISSVWETAPLDSPGNAGPYLNLAVSGVTDLEPGALLGECQSIERRFGKRSPERNAPRRLDIDIVWMDGIERATIEPLVPHPRFRQRAFVLEPLREIGFDRFDARSGRMLRALRGSGEIRPHGRLW